MKVKIGDRIYDASEEPILLILTKEDKDNVRNMDPDATKLCAYPKGINPDYIKAFIKTKYT